MLICARGEGSGSVLSLAVYKGDREVLRVEGAEEGGLQLESAGDAPPTLIIWAKHRWLDHKLDPWVAERYTFATAGQYDRAAADMAAPPAGGVKSYLTEHAPDLLNQTPITLSTNGRDPIGLTGLEVARGSAWRPLQVRPRPGHTHQSGRPGDIQSTSPVPLAPGFSTRSGQGCPWSGANV